MSSASSPSHVTFVLRALLSLALLIAFYVLTLAIALVLLALPPLFVAFGQVRVGVYLLFVFAVCWIPAVLLVRGAFLVRPLSFTPPGPRLTPAEAPELFTLLDDLGARAKTDVPSEVYLAPSPTLAVTETGGMLGLGSKRILILGAPLLDALTVEELRAGLAHELGHFAGGDTRLTGLLSYTAASFRSVFASVQRGAFREGTTHSAIEAGFGAARIIGEALVQGYARLYFRVMNASGRRQELAADALAARIVGRDAVIRLLEKVTVLGPTYDAYLTGDVAFAVNAGAMPLDLLEGYRRFRARFDATPSGKELAEAQRTSKTEPYDTHPAPALRIARLRAHAAGAVLGDERSALALLADEPRLRAWLVDVTMGLLQPKRVLRRMPWSRIPDDVYLPFAKERARELAAKLFTTFPESTTLTAMFASVVRAFEQGEAARVVGTVLAELERLPPHARAEVVQGAGGGILGNLFLGALLERGGALDDSLGAPCLLVRIDDELVPAGKLAADAMHDEASRALVGRWAARLAARPA